MRAKPIVFGLLLAIAVVAWFALDLGRFLTLEKLHEHQEWLVEQKNASPLLFGAVFFAVYVLITGASIPGATVLTLAAGSVFGLLWGIVLVSFASALGATIAFVVARYLLRDFVRRRFENQSAQRLSSLGKAAPFRPQPDRHRRRRRRPGRRLYRGGRQGESHARGRRVDGGRLPQFRLRSIEGSDSGSKIRSSSASRGHTWLAQRAHGIRFWRSDGAHPTRYRDDRTARLGRALYRARRGGPAGARKNRLSVVGRDKQFGRNPDADHARHCHRGGFESGRPADPRALRREVPHLGHPLGRVQTSRAARRAGRWSDRLRARAGTGTAWRHGNGGGDGRSHTAP